MSKRTGLLVLACMVVVAGAMSCAVAAASFQPLGYLDDGTDSNSVSLVYAISPDGTVVVGSSYPGYRVNRLGYIMAFRWTAAGGMVNLGDIPGRRWSEARAVSADGAVVVGNSGSVGFRWTLEQGMIELGSLPGGKSKTIVKGISEDGQVIVGSSSSAASEAGGHPIYIDYEAFRWTAESGMVGLGDLLGGSFSSHASGVSADGGVIVGASRSEHGLEAFRWTAEEGMVGLGDLPGGSFSSRAAVVSADGSIIVGTSNTNDGEEVFRWTSESGMTSLGNLPGAYTHILGPTAMSADGTVIVGEMDTINEYDSFIWTQEDGIRYLVDVLVNDYGLDLTGWRNFQAKGISADGKTIIGFAINSRHNTEAWIVTIPEPGTLVVMGIGLGCVLRWRV